MALSPSYADSNPTCYYRAFAGGTTLVPSLNFVLQRITTLFQPGTEIEYIAASQSHDMSILGWTAAVLGGTGLCIVAAPAAVAVPILGVVGFSAKGVIAGSIAAGIQAGIGSVIAGTAFASLTSAGVEGAGMAAVAVVTQTAGIVLAGAGVGAVVAAAR